MSRHATPSRGLYHFLLTRLHSLLTHPLPPGSYSPPHCPTYFCLINLLKTLPFIMFFFFLFNHFFYCCSNTIVSIFPPPLSPAPPILTYHPQSSPFLAFCMGPLYMFLDNPFPSFPHYLPPHSPLVTVRLFFISMPLGIFCLLVWFGKNLLFLCLLVWTVLHCRGK